MLLLTNIYIGLLSRARVASGPLVTSTSGSSHLLTTLQVNKIFTIPISTIGNSMAFAGIPNGKDRADLVAYLKTKVAE
jgi:cytochrome c2